MAQNNVVDVFIANATPQNIDLGTADYSGRAVTLAPIKRAMFMPYIPFYAQKGPLDEVIVDGNAFTTIFGDDTLDEDSPYFNHSSVFLKAILQEGGTIIAKRILSEDANKLGSLRLYIDYVETEVEEYERDASGQFVKDDNGDYVTTGRTLPGIKYKFVVGEVPSESIQVGDDTVTTWNFGLGSEEAGDQLDDATGNTSKRVPLFDIAAPSPGAYANLSGISIWAPTTIDPYPINNVALADTDSYPFRLSVKTKATPTSSPVVSTTMKGSREIDFSLKAEAKSRAGVKYQLEEVFIKEYNNLKPEDPTTPATYGSFSRIHVYQDNIDAVLKLFMEKETADTNSIIGTPFESIDGTDEEQIKENMYLFNLFTGRHIDGTPYQTYRIGDTSASGTILGDTITVWASGGSDGEMNDDLFANAVNGLLNQFNDTNSIYMDDTRFNDSVFIDTGYPLETKKLLGKYISARKDRFVIATTHVAGEDNIIPVAEENARITFINGYARAYPDSTIFGTGTFRFITCKGTMELKPSVSNYSHRIPITYELVRLFTKWAGNTEGRHRPRWDYTEGDNNYFKYGTNVSNSWTPYAVRNEAWSAGGMWAERSEYGLYYFPAIRTIYADDTSTLMTPRIMMVHVELHKIGNEMQRQFTGKDWSQSRFKQEIEDWFYNRIGGNKFAGRVDIQFDVVFTELDEERGYAWHGIAKVYGDGIKTVQTFYSENYRSSDKPTDFNGIRA